MPGRFQRSVDSMDANAWDDDGRWRLSTYAKSDYAFWNVAALAALIVWLFF